MKKKSKNFFKIRKNGKTLFYYSAFKLATECHTPKPEPEQENGSFKETPAADLLSTSMSPEESQELGKKINGLASNTKQLMVKRPREEDLQEEDGEEDSDDGDLDAEDEHSVLDQFDISLTELEGALESLEGAPIPFLVVADLHALAAKNLALASKIRSYVRSWIKPSLGS